MKLRCWLSLVLLMLCQVRAGQKPSTKQPEVVLRSTTRLVEVNVVVHDKKGQFVRDLTKEDFVLEELGKRQEIRVFTIQSKDVQRRAIEAPAPGTFSNQRAEQAPEAGGVSVILFDCLNTSWADQANTRRHVLDFLQQIQPQDKVALYALTSQLRILHDFTQDASSLVKALTTYRGIHMPNVAASDPSMVAEMHNGALANADPKDKDGARALEAIETLIDSLKEEAFNAEKNRVLTTLGALEAISNHLAGVPGRKNLIWVSGSFPLAIGFFEATDEGPGLNAVDSPYSAKTAGSNPRARRSNAVAPPVQPTKHGRAQTFDLEFKRTVRALNAANLAVYPVDARGLSTNPNVWTGITTMKDLAAATGGKAYYNRNDIMNSVRESFEDSEVTYTLAYYPKEQNGDGRYRTIKVKVDRPGLVVRHRRGYYDFGESARGEGSRLADMQETLWSPLDATGVPLDAHVERHDPDGILLSLKVDASKISLEPRGERLAGKLDLLLAQTDNQGRQYEGSSQTLSVEFSQQDYQTALEKGVYYRSTLRPAPGATTLRVVVRDPQTGALGRVTIPFDKIP